MSLRMFGKYFILGVLLTTPLVIAEQVSAAPSGAETACCGSSDCSGGSNLAQCGMATRCGRNCTAGSALYNECLDQCSHNSPAPITSPVDPTPTPPVEN
jgi:hypothetical protein